MGEFSFGRKYRLQHRKEFDRVFASRVRAGDDVLLVYGAPNLLGHPRLGLTVSRKLGKATFRNRWKRLIREAFRLNRRQLPQELDLVVIPRAGVQPQLDRVTQSLIQLAWQVRRKWDRRQRTEEKHPGSG